MRLSGIVNSVFKCGSCCGCGGWISSGFGGGCAGYSVSAGVFSDKFVITLVLLHQDLLYILLMPCYCIFY